MKQFLLALGLCTATGLASSTLHAQPTGDEKKCFPSGYSLINALMSSTGDYVAVTNVNNLTKTFDTRTLRPVYAYNGISYPEQYFPVPKKTEASYRLHVKELGSQDYPPKLMQVKDRQGKVVSEYTTDGVEHHFFIPASGALIVAEDMNVYLMRPGKKKTRIAKDEDTWRVDAYPTFTPDGMYSVASSGDVVDVADGSLRRRVFAGNKDKPAQVVFNSDLTEFSTGVPGQGVITYNLKTGKEVRRVPIPADLPRIDGFEVLVAPNGRDFLYWLYFYNKAAAGGLAYWVHDGKGTSLCDPLWEQEHKENFTRILNEAVERKEQEELAKKRADEEAARRPAGSINHSTADMTGFQNNTSGTTGSGSAPEKPVQMVTCGACYGEGFRTTSSTTHRQISAPTYKLHSSGYADRVSSGQSTSSTTTTKTRCAVCGSSGKVPKR